MKYKLPVGSCRFRSGAITVLIFLLLLLQTTHAKIVFNSKRSDGRTSQLYVMGDSGQNVHRLTHSEFHDRYPRWFPDGERILFQQGLTEGADNVFDSEFYILSVSVRYTIPETRHSSLHSVGWETTGQCFYL